MQHKILKAPEAVTHTGSCPEALPKIIFIKHSQDFF